ncbi:MAG: hypothetical protein IPI64_00005 [Chloracidobacterium sp.]|nr:hypothetical protein [Chloracidobacterium sp.]
MAERSGRLVRAHSSGIVSEVKPGKLVVTNKTTSETYQLLQEYPSAADTPLGHRTLVTAGKKVKRGDLLASWTGTIGDEAVFGRNVLVGYLPFKGHNIDDGIVVSQSVADKFCLSRHITNTASS